MTFADESVVNEILNSLVSGPVEVMKSSVNHQTGASEKVKAVIAKEVQRVGKQI